MRRLAVSGLAALALAALLAGCGSGIQGTYADEFGITRMTFKRDGTVVQSAMGTEVEMEYEVDGDKVRLKTPMGALLLTRVDDDTLSGPMGATFKRE